MVHRRHSVLREKHEEPGAGLGEAELGRFGMVPLAANAAALFASLSAVIATRGREDLAPFNEALFPSIILFAIGAAAALWIIAIGKIPAMRQNVKVARWQILVAAPVTGLALFLGLFLVLAVIYNRL